MLATEVRMDSKTYERLMPGAHPAVIALGKAVAETGLEPELLELVRLRCSQLNGCAFCVEYHTQHLRRMNYSRDKQTLVVVWREAGIFSEREQAALDWAESVTLVAETRVPDSAYEAVSRVFNERELAGLTTAIAEINVWNRLSVAFRRPPELES